MFGLATGLVLAVGLAMAAQSPTNANLGLKVGVFQASLVSFTGGFLCLAVLVALFGQGNLAAALDLPRWQVIGGLYGAFTVFAISLSTPRLGVALTLALVMLGQLVGGMAVDQFGLLMAARIAVSPLRLLGCLLVLAGIVCVYRGSSKASSGLVTEGSGLAIACAVLSFAAGVTGALQAPTNAALAQSVGTFEASFISFGGGVIALLIATLVHNKGRFNSFKEAKPWMLTGGLYGAFGVTATVVATPILGVSLVMAGTMLGQLLGGMCVDGRGLFRVRKVKVNGWRIAGAAVLLAGIALVTTAKLTA